MIESLDETWMRALHGTEPASLSTHFFVAMTWLGSGWALLVLLPFLFGRRTRPPVLALLSTLAVTALVVFVVKALVHRPRPFVTMLAIVPLITPPTDFSFPSGHAAGSAAFALFVSIAWLLPAMRAERPGRSFALGAGILACLAFALSVAFSRVHLGVHYPLDVLAGATIGAALGTAGALVARRSRLASGPRGST